jgi:hypothetical protein
MQLPVLYALMTILALMAMFDIMSTAIIIFVDPQHFHEGVPWIAATMHRLGVVPALLLWRLPFIVWALTFYFPQAAGHVLPMAYVNAVVHTSEYVFLFGLVFYGWVCVHNGKALARALATAAAK